MIEKVCKGFIIDIQDNTIVLDLGYDIIYKE